jgi:branched-chain amino acid transport system ATP-binding protein
MALLEVEELRVGYGFPVLLGIDFEVAEGETAVLFGLNGAGKTTTLSTVAGLLKPDGGAIRFDGTRIDGRSPTWLVRHGIALVPEGRRVFPALSVENNLRLGGWTRRRSKPDLERQRELVFEYFPRLAERADQDAGTLSGGEQQMLAIGRALMSRPRLLLIDEASLGLSPALAKSVFQVVAQINDDGTTVVIVEQNVGVLPYADRALIMEKGTLVFSGVGDEIRHANLRETYLGGEPSESSSERTMQHGEPSESSSERTIERGEPSDGAAPR